jgi:hypothetical protein
MPDLWPYNNWMKGFLLINLLGIYISLGFFVIESFKLVSSSISLGFMSFSSYLKDKFQIDHKSSIPIGTLSLYFLGETIAFIIKSVKFFSS